MSAPIAALLLTFAVPQGRPGEDGARVVAAPPGVLAPRAPSERRIQPELAEIRYRDPGTRGRLWLGLEVGGVALPGRLTGLGRPVWVQRTAGAWALALGSRLAVGGRHDLVWYDARNIRLQANEHRLSLSGAPAGTRWPRLRDRLALGVESHVVRRSWVEGKLFKLGGLWDTVVSASYAMEHRLGRRLALAWSVSGRYVWVYNDTQRQGRTSLRLALAPGGGHRVALEGVGYLIHRDPDQLGKPMPRWSAVGQLNLEHQWIGRRGVGTYVRLHYATSFMSGRAPVYEVREETLRAQYGELSLGLRVAL